jgi:hypothetical protein
MLDTGRLCQRRSDAGGRSRLRRAGRCGDDSRFVAEELATLRHHSSTRGAARLPIAAGGRHVVAILDVGPAVDTDHASQRHRIVGGNT